MPQSTTACIAVPYAYIDAEVKAREQGRRNRDSRDRFLLPVLLKLGEFHCTC